MSVNFREGKIESPNQVFQVSNLKKLNFDLFRKACIACMMETTKFRAHFNIPSSNDYILYKGKNEGIIKIRNWSNLLTILCVSKNGTWIESSHIGGENQDDIIKEAWRHICRAKPLINKELRKVVWEWPERK